MSSPPPRLPVSRKESGTSGCGIVVAANARKILRATRSSVVIVADVSETTNDTVFGVTDDSYVTGRFGATGLAVVCVVKKLANVTEPGVTYVADVGGLHVVTVAVFSAALAGTTRVRHQHLL
ncbi:hypothetical protein MRX96_047397 [Rhipicephalus microplus]